MTRAADAAVTPGHELTNLRRDLHRELHAAYHRNDKAAAVTQRDFSPGLSRFTFSSSVVHARASTAFVRRRSLNSSTTCSAAAQNGAAAATISATSQRGGMDHAGHATYWLCHSLRARASSIRHDDGVMGCHGMVAGRGGASSLRLRDPQARPGGAPFATLRS